MRQASSVCLGLVVLCGWASPGRGAADPTPAQIIPSLADQLVDRQVKTGAMQGSWPGEEAFSATLACGLIHAYALTCDSRYRDAAELAAGYAANAAKGNLLGDEAYAFVRLGEIIGPEAGQRYLETVQSFYADVKEHAVGSTSGYISSFAQVEPSTAVLYLAYHAVAAHRVGAEDGEVWRRGLIEYLARVDDTSADYPVTALGIAVWALAETGPLDNSLVDMSEAGAPYWQGKTLQDLPNLLLGHQVGAEGLLPGSFYWRFDHGDGGFAGPESGYTEDLVFASLGLVAATRSQVNPGRALSDAVDAARSVLLESLVAWPTVQQHLWLLSADYLFYTGEVLTGLAWLVPRSDLNLDGEVDMVDFSLLAANWRSSRCSGECACGRADLNSDEKVDWSDVAQVAKEWLD